LHPLLNRRAADTFIREYYQGKFHIPNITFSKDPMHTPNDVFGVGKKFCSITMESYRDNALDEW